MTCCVTVGATICGAQALWGQARLAASSATEPKTAKQVATIAEAEAAMERQQWPEAEEILRKLVADNGVPDTVAGKASGKAVAGKTKNARAWFDLGYVMHEQKKYAEAITAYRAAVAAEPDSFECNLNLGLMLAHEKQPDAAKYLEAATGLKPTGDHPRQSLARAWTALAEVQEATDAESSLNSWQRAVTLEPGDGQKRLGYGEALDRSGDAAGAEREFRKATELLPNSADALAALANLTMRRMRLADAEELLRRLVAITPRD
jgi:Flp pilus assembly protein TadD